MKTPIKITDEELLKITLASPSHLHAFKKIKEETTKEAENIKKHFFERKIRVLGVSGSMRSVNDMSAEGSNSEKLLDFALDECKNNGAEIKKLVLRDYDIQPCKACYSTTNTQCHFKCSCYSGNNADDMTNKIYDMISWADAIIFATPINNFKVSSMMSLFIDRCISMDGSLSPADTNNAKDKTINTQQVRFIETTASEKFGSGFLKRFTGKIGGIIAVGHEAGASLAISSLYMTLNHFGMLFPPFSNMYAVNTYCEGTYKDKPKVTSKCYEEEARIVAKNVITAAKITKRKNDYWWTYDNRMN